MAALIVYSQVHNYKVTTHWFLDIIHVGETHHIKERSYTHIYKYMEANPVGPKRTKSETLNHMKTAFSSNSTVIQLPYGAKF